MRAPWPALLLASACGGARAPAPPGPAGSATKPGAELRFTGTCDASGAVPLGDTRFVVASDEDNLLRTYDLAAPGAPVATRDLSPSLTLPALPPEIDVEAAATLGDRAYWMTSHGRAPDGRARPERHRFFATTTPGDGLGVTLVGRPYEALLADLLAAPALARFDLARAATLPPKAVGGLNLEGLTDRPEGDLLLGFRSPVPEGRALLVPLTNPREVIEEGARATLGAPQQLDLGGLGVRALARWRDRYLIVAGAHDGGGPSRLFVWDGVDAAVDSGVNLAGYNPEGIVSGPDADEVLLLSDDGEVLVDGVPCKDLADPQRQRFRGVWVRP